MDGVIAFCFQLSAFNFPLFKLRRRQRADFGDAAEGEGAGDGDTVLTQAGNDFGVVAGHHTGAITGGRHAFWSGGGEVKGHRTLKVITFLTGLEDCGPTLVVVIWVVLMHKWTGCVVEQNGNRPAQAAAQDHAAAALLQHAVKRQMSRHQATGAGFVLL